MNRLFRLKPDKAVLLLCRQESEVHKKGNKDRQKCETEPAKSVILEPRHFQEAYRARHLADEASPPFVWLVCVFHLKLKYMLQIG